MKIITITQAMRLINRSSVSEVIACGTFNLCRGNTATTWRPGKEFILIYDPKSSSAVVSYRD